MLQKITLLSEVCTVFCFLDRANGGKMWRNVRYTRKEILKKAITCSTKMEKCGDENMKNICTENFESSGSQGVEFSPPTPPPSPTQNENPVRLLMKCVR